MANFDSIAPFYDLLGRLVFGKRLKTAPLCFLTQLPPVRRILIVGGGTGAMVPNVRNTFPQAHITFIEPSSNMMKRAQNRGVSRVDWFNKTLEDFHGDELFDLIFTPFVLDIYHDEELSINMIKIESMLTAEGNWIHSDFYHQGSIWWQSLMLKMMYRFFRWTVDLSTNTLPDFDTHFERLQSLSLVRSKSWMQGFIKTSWWQKQKEQPL